jgi:hypothetical protein
MSEIPRVQPKEVVAVDRRVAIDHLDVDLLYETIRIGFRDTDSASLLRQSMTLEEFKKEAADTSITKITGTDENKNIRAYASIFNDVSKMSWLDIDGICKATEKSLDTLLGVGSIVIDHSARGYNSVARLLSEVGSYAHEVYSERQGCDRDFGVIFDCAPTNHDLPLLIKNILDTYIDNSYVEIIGYQTTLLVCNPAEQKTKPPTPIPIIDLTKIIGHIDIDQVIRDASGFTLIKLPFCIKPSALTDSDSILQSDTQRIYIAGYTPHAPGLAVNA